MRNAASRSPSCQPYRAREIERRVGLDPVRGELGIRGVRVLAGERDGGKAFAASEKIGVVAHGRMLPRQREQLDVVAPEHDAVVRRAQRVKAPRRERETEPCVGLLRAIEVANRDHDMIDASDGAPHIRARWRAPES